MELMECGVRPSSMMSPRHVRGPVLAVLLCSALAGCASATSSAAAGAPAASSAAVASSVSASPPAAAVGCASVDQATSVTVHRTMHLVEPTRMDVLSMTQHNATLVRALFGQFCDAVGHAATATGTIHCPADFGISYAGTFYDGSRALAKFVYGASGCQTVSITANGKTQTTMVFGPASAAAPKLRADMAAVLGLSVSQVYGAPSQSLSPVKLPTRIPRPAGTTPPATRSATTASRPWPPRHIWAR